MTDDFYVVLYLLYGFTFIIMGIYAIREHKRSYSVFPLVNAIIYLGVFGIAHGLSEWLTMLRYANIFDVYRIEIFFISRILKALSFLALIQFGFSLLLKPFWRKFGSVFLVVYFIMFVTVFYIIVFINGIEYLYDNPVFLIVTLRYFMAFPGAVLSMSVLIYQGLKVKNIDRLWMKYYFYLGFIILIYGILDGVFVRRADFFPANTINSQWFIETINIPIQVFKIITGLGLYLGIRLVINSFTWERKSRWVSLKTEEELLRQKQHLNQLLHDDLIQSLFISGIKIEGLKEECEDHVTIEAFDYIIDSMNFNIEKIRRYIKSNQQETIAVKDFNKEINKLIEDTLHSKYISVDYRNRLDEQDIHVINREILTHIYYILKELLLNIVKHAQAERAKILVYQEIQFIKISVEDNGVGFDTKKEYSEKHVGLKSIKQRVEELNGSLKIISSKNKWYKASKTQVTVLIPIEVNHV